MYDGYLYCPKICPKSNVKIRQKNQSFDDVDDDDDYFNVDDDDDHFDARVLAEAKVMRRRHLGEALACQ